MEENASFDRGVSRIARSNVGIACRGLAFFAALAGGVEREGGGAGEDRAARTRTEC